MDSIKFEVHHSDKEQIFNSFASIQYKHALVQTLFNRARNICAVDTLEMKLETLKYVNV